MALTEAIRNSMVLQTSPVLENLSHQVRQLSEIMNPYQQMMNNIQESLRLITEGLISSRNFDSKTYENEKEEIKNDNLLLYTYFIIFLLA